MVSLSSWELYTEIMNTWKICQFFRMTILKSVYNWFLKRDFHPILNEIQDFNR